MRCSYCKYSDYKYASEHSYDSMLLTGEVVYLKNICMWADGTLRPAKGHDGSCKWGFDGQVWYHLTKHNQFDSIKVSERMNTNG